MQFQIKITVYITKYFWGEDQAYLKINLTNIYCRKFDKYVKAEKEK